MPKPVDDTQQLALEAIWDSLVREGRWPTFHELDQRLYREHDLDAARLLPQLPAGLLHGVNHGSSIFIAGNAPIGLTIAGVAATGRPQREVNLFLAVVRHAVVVERNFDPPTDQPDLRPVLSAADMAVHLGLTSREDSPLLRRLGAILYAERWGSRSFGGYDSDAWQASIDRDVREFRQVGSLDEYWELRPKHWEPPPRPAAPSQTPSAATTTPRAGVPDVAILADPPAGRDTDTGASDRSSGSAHRVDVLVVAALPEEMAAARDAALATDPNGPGVIEWKRRDLDGSPYLWGEYRIDGGTRFTVALARPTHMGGRTTGTFAATIADRLSPAALAMSGVCAGNPEETTLGDVVVGDPVYEWDEGKLSPSGFHAEHRHIPMDSRWLRTAQEFDPSVLSSHGDATEEQALLWFLQQLEHGRQPRNHPALKAYFPRGTWLPRLERLEAEGWITRESNGSAVLTAAGSNRLRQWLHDDVDGPQQLPFRVLDAPMASGSAVISNPGQWGQLKAMGVRKIAAIEMEAAAMATIAHDRGLPWLVAKGVMDHADSTKDDRYKDFAARASAQVMFALLAQLMTSEEAGPRHTSTPAKQSTPSPVALGRAAGSTRRRASGVTEKRQSGPRQSEAGSGPSARADALRHAGQSAVTPSESGGGDNSEYDGPRLRDVAVRRIGLPPDEQARRTASRISGLTDERALAQLQAMNNDDAERILVALSDRRAAELLSAAHRPWAAQRLLSIQRQRAMDIAERLPDHFLVSLAADAGRNRIHKLLQLVGGDRAGTLLAQIPLQPAERSEVVAAMSVEQGVALLVGAPVPRALVLLRHLPVKHAAMLLAQMPVRSATAILREVEASQAAAVLEAVPIDAAARLLEALPARIGRRVVPVLSPPQRTTILAAVEPGRAAALVSTRPAAQDN